MFVPKIQMEVISVRSIVLVNLSNHQLLVNLSFPLMSVVSVKSAVLANSIKHFMLRNLSVPVMQLILSFAIPLVCLFLILLVIVSHLNLFVNLLMWYRKILMNNLFIFHHNFCNNNVDNFFEGYVKCNNISSNKFLTSNSFICHEFNNVATFNILHRNILSSSIYFYHFSFSFYKYSFFTNSAFYIFNVNSVTNSLNNDFYITYLFDKDNRFLFWAFGFLF